MNFQIDNGIDGLVPVGTTGECPTLSHIEHKKVVERVVKAAAGRVPVIAGAGSNNTVEAIRFVQFAESIGADAALVVTPYYNRPPQAGLQAHFERVADAANIPVYLYNVPARTGRPHRVRLSPDGHSAIGHTICRRCDSTTSYA